MMTRTEHLEQCKQRARVYLNAGDLPNAVASMLSDLSKHPETEKLAGPEFSMLCILAAANHNRELVQRLIEGFR
jgi:hypothetical protein